MFSRYTTQHASLLKRKPTFIFQTKNLDPQAELGLYSTKFNRKNMFGVMKSFMKMERIGTAAVFGEKSASHCINVQPL